MQARGKTFLILAAVILLAAVDLCSGGGSLSIADSLIFMKLRLPRMLSAVLGGACLALSGLQMQSIFRNPLADPHLMGVSAGAGTGAAIATLIAGSSIPVALSGLTVAGAAFLGAAISCVMVTMSASRLRDVTSLLVFGVMLGFVFSAITSILEYSANAENLKVFYSWSAGSFMANRPAEILIMAAALAVGLTLSLTISKRLDITLFGDEYATLVGADPSRTRIIALLGACLMTGAVTAFCGPLGFVGIVSPHLSRTILGTSMHARTIPCSIIIGSGLALAADIISQIAPWPLPVGSTMALIGIPIIIHILITHRDA
ncbi:MAG: iron ABC transporter permease [Bacteroidales bacterium]|nr:iron ABC transporter permease [Candidatus Cryptobacteroides faecihippi]